MGLKSIKNRLEKVKSNTGMNISKELLEAIKSKKSYGQLSDELKEEYCQYRYETSRSVHEEVHNLLHEACDIDGRPLYEFEVLEFKPKPMTEAEWQKHLKETTEWIEAFIKEQEEQEEATASYHGVKN